MRHIHRDVGGFFSDHEAVVLEFVNLGLENVGIEILFVFLLLGKVRARGTVGFRVRWWLEPRPLLGAYVAFPRILASLSAVLATKVAAFLDKVAAIVALEAARNFRFL